MMFSCICIYFFVWSGHENMYPFTGSRVNANHERSELFMNKSASNWELQDQSQILLFASNWCVQPTNRPALKGIYCISELCSIYMFSYLYMRWSITLILCTKRQLVALLIRSKTPTKSTPGVHCVTYFHFTNAHVNTINQNAQQTR